MKLLVLLLMAACAVPAACAQQPAEKTADVNALSWMLGTWDRQGTREGQTGFERWEKVSDTELRGEGVTMQGADTVFVEKLSVVVREGELFYVAEVSHNEEPTWFKITEITETGFVSENLEHDFPKKISYALDGERLTAEISGDGRAMAFVFVRRE